MELGTILVIAYLALWLIGKVAGGEDKKRRVPQLPQAPGQGAGEPRARPQTLEDLLAEMQTAAGQTDGNQLPVAKTDPEQLPVEFDRPVVSYDTEIADFGERGRQAAARRLAEADARNHGRTAEDHRRFDRMIRRKVVIAQPLVDPQYRKGLRSAVVWREVLGTPVSLRDD